MHIYKTTSSIYFVTFTSNSYRKLLLSPFPLIPTMFLQTILLAVFFVFGTTSQVCPPAEDVLPCGCEESGRLVCTKPFAVKEYFDRISSIVSEDHIFPDLYLTRQEEVEFPADTIQTLKFQKLSIESNQLLESIHPDAFTGTFDVTTNLYLGQHDILWGNDSSGFFDLVNNFTKLDSLSARLNRKIISIPDEAFGSHPEMKYISMIAYLDYLGSKLFAQMPKLIDLHLAYCSLGDGEIAEDAFDGMAKNVNVDLRYNHFTRMPENVFKTLLDNAKTVVVGGETCEPWSCYDEEFICDEGIAWICKNATVYQPKLEGFKCTNYWYDDIWDYCASNFNTSSHV